MPEEKPVDSTPADESEADDILTAQTAAATSAPDDSESVSATWDELGLGETSREAIRRLGYAAPTPVQVKTIPLVHAGRDLVVQAMTGSGKTLAFGLPILEKLDPASPVVQALVLSPTRELALQVSQEITRAGSLGNRTVAPIYGGASMNAQIRWLREGAQVVVGTPGRILDHMRRGTLNLDRAWMVVLDEADEMLDRGFLPDVTRILEATPKTRQTMLFSATIPAQIHTLAERYLVNPESITIGKTGMSINYDIHHSYCRVPKLHRFVALVNLLHSIPRTKVLIFCNQKSDTESVAEHLHEEGFAVGFLSGDLSQSMRDRTLQMFKDEVIDVLVATDVAARGIDIFGVSHVINYDVPENKERYVHRTGRTGRAGRRGEALSLVTPADLLGIGQIQRTMGVNFDELSVPTQEEAAANVRHNVIRRLQALEGEGYPEDLALFADDLLDAMEPYTAVAGLLTLLRQHGWQLEIGYDPNQPEHKERMFVRPMLLGLADLKQRKQRETRGDSDRGPRRGRERSERGERGERRERPERRERSGRSERSEKSPVYTDAAPASTTNVETTRPEKSSAREWLVLSMGREEGLADPGAFISFVCQNGGVKKYALGAIQIGEHETRFEIAADVSDKIIDVFARRKREPKVTVSKLSE
ncbi:MAG: DEAD/DEAH box helicase [Myxococcales bacterium]|nr:MAG: DEAD/DEAH box helicase [Myxococcales bacterium]